MTSFNVENLPPLVPSGAPRNPPEPLLRWMRGFDDADQLDSEEGELVRVHCGGCLRRAYDLTIIRTPIWRDVYGEELAEWRRTNKVLVSRMCPKCNMLNRGYLTLAPGNPLKDGLRGPWVCSHCRTSLAYVDANKGRIKASCKRCDENVTTSAHNAFFGNLKLVDDERTRRLLIDLEASF